MLFEEIVAVLTEINQDTNLPQKQQGEVDVEYVNRMWPGIISGVTNFVMNEDGTRNYNNIVQLKGAGFHTFATNRNSNPAIPSGRVRTDKGMIAIY